MTYSDRCYSHLIIVVINDSERWKGPFFPREQLDDISILKTFLSRDETHSQLLRLRNKEFYELRFSFQFYTYSNCTNQHCFIWTFHKDMKKRNM